MASVFNTFESPGSGVQLTAGSGSNADGSTAWSSVTVGTGGTLAPSTTHVYAGSQSLKVATGSTAAATYAQMAAPSSSHTQWARIYCYFTANPPSGFRFLQSVTALGGVCGSLSVNSSGKLVQADLAGTTQTTSTASIPLNAWFRIEVMHFASATVGQLEVKLFDTVESTTPTETNTSAASLNTGTDPVTAWHVGQSSGNANVGPAWFDNLKLSDTAYPGPAATPATVALPALSVALAAQMPKLAIPATVALPVTAVTVAAPAPALTSRTLVALPHLSVSLTAPALTVMATVNSNVFLALPALTMFVRAPSVSVALSGKYIFRPPTQKLSPSDPQGERLWLYFGIDTGISVIQRQDGTWYETTYPSTDEYDAAKRVYLGGYEYELDDDEYAALVAAGYLQNFDGAGESGYGAGPFGGGSYGE